ncbi:hypothetical protein E3J74_09195 [Candidatus Bathyarchaeota archaeon]|nr:MAG: hypothetical protein E3J74_09195 [Candidatus Bathyarchaeota archaeon]
MNYLFDPNKLGVYFTTVEISISSLKKLFQEIHEFDKKTEVGRTQDFKLLEREIPSHYSSEAVTQWAIEDLSKALNHLNIYEPKEGILSSKILRPQTLVTTQYLGFIRRRAQIDKSTGAFFPDAYLKPNICLLNTMDAISVKPSFHSPNLIIDVFSVKQSGSQTFRKLIDSIPIIGEKAEIIERGKKHSSRYCYEPYPAAAMLWTSTIAYGTIPEDLLNFFDGSIRYWEKQEWRISIILSAIAVESILAEIYEEQFHKIAPPDPLGALRDKIEKKQKFPPKTRNDINLVNQSRIASVHRSSMQVGEREARNALMGAIRFTHWTFSEGSLSRITSRASK